MTSLQFHVFWHHQLAWALWCAEANARLGLPDRRTRLARMFRRACRKLAEARDSGRLGTDAEAMVARAAFNVGGIGAC